MGVDVAVDDTDSRPLPLASPCDSGCECACDWGCSKYSDEPTKDELEGCSKDDDVDATKDVRWPARLPK